MAVPLLVNGARWAVDFIADQCARGEEPKSLVSSPILPQSSTPASCVSCTPLASGDIHGSIHDQNPVGLEESAISGLVSLSHLESSTEDAVNDQWHSTQAPEPEAYSHANEVLAFTRPELLECSSLDISNCAIYSTPSFESKLKDLTVLNRSPNLELSNREAVLLRNYIENVAPWVFGPLITVCFKNG